MFNRHVELCLHFIWSTEARVPWVTADRRARIHGVIASVARSDGCVPVVVGGIDEHVHIVLRAPPTVVPSELVGRLKGVSSRFAHTELDVDRALTWEEGYALFSVDPRAFARVAAYARDQPRHHATGDLVAAWEIPDSLASLSRPPRT